MHARHLGSAKRLSVVAPCFNEQDGIDEFYRRVSAVCAASVGDSYEIVLVNDGSTDSTLSALRTLSERDSHVVVVDLARNYGHQIALTAGLEFAGGERILILDADLQDPPELLPQMMALMDEGNDVVYGQRRRRSSTYTTHASHSARPVRTRGMSGGTSARASTRGARITTPAPRGGRSARRGTPCAGPG